MDKFVIKNPNPFIMQVNFGNPPQDVDNPLSTVTGIDHSAFVAVSLSSRYSDGADGRGAKVDDPMPTVTGTNHSNLLAANVVHYYGGADHASNLNKPLPTVTALPRHYLTESHLCVLRNNMDCRGMDEPFPTVTAKEHEAVICTYLQELGEFKRPCDYANDCCICKRAIYEHSIPNCFTSELIFAGCDNSITRPPKSWQFVDEL